jgi:DNA replication regulator DPB11
VLRNVLKENGAFLVDSLSDMSKLPGVNCSLFVIVPYCMPEPDIPSVEGVHPTPRIVTDMWIERCLAYKTYLDPDDHPAGTPVGRFPVNGFGELKINSTGFENIELLHLSKLIRLGGATYDEILQPEISVLICNKTRANAEKQRYARAWGIPVVSDAWLWACLRSGRLQSFDAYTSPAAERGERDFGRAATEATTKPQFQEDGQEPKDARNPKPTDKLGKDHDTEWKMPGRDEVTSRWQKSSGQTQPRPGADFLEDSATLSGPQDDVGATTGRPHGQNPESKQYSDIVQPSLEDDTDAALPLQEICNDSPPKGPESSPTKKKKKHLFRPFEGNGSIASTAMSNDVGPAAPAPTSTGKTEYVPPQTDSINDAIHDLLNMTSRARASAPPTSEGGTRKTRLLGRALSNMSNSSRQSRASSVDTMNTDGIGSVIGADGSQSGKPKSSIGRTGSFTGRAKAKAATQNGPLTDLIDPGLCRDEFADEEPTPPMTQLGYGEHEDAVKIREKLAEKRRNRARQGQETFLEVAEEKRIKDDEAILGAGWGAGRRTRQKEHSPKGMEGF